MKNVSADPHTIAISHKKKPGRSLAFFYLFCVRFLLDQADNRADRVPLAALFHGVDIGKAIKIKEI